MDEQNANALRAIIWGIFLLCLAVPHARNWFKKVRKERFFKSPRYRENRAALHACAERLKQLLRESEPIGQIEIQRFIDESKSCLSFFKRLVSAPEGDADFIQDYLQLTNAPARLREHDDRILSVRREELKDFANRFQFLLDRPAPIGEQEIQAFVKSGSEVVAFFSRNPSWIDNTTARGCFDLYADISNILRQHDAEIQFLKTVAAPLRALLEGPEYITMGQWSLLRERHRALIGPMSICTPAIRPGTDSALALFEGAEAKIREHNRQIAAEIRFEKDFAEPFKKLLAEDRYIAHSQWNSVCQQGWPLAEPLIRSKLLRPSTKEHLLLLNASELLVGRHNRAFVEHEAMRCSRFFDTLDKKYQLDPQQRECCIVDDDAALVIAGAGSGKTSVIAAKVAYLMQKRGIPPSEIRLITYTNEATEEMSKRITQYIGGQYATGPEVSTFHKFGMNLLQLPGGKIAKKDALKCVVQKIMTGKADYVDDDYSLLVEFVALHLSQEELEGAFASESGQGPRMGRGKLITLQGERVKSHEELRIANFLFFNGVRYEYEKPYSKPYQREAWRKAYCPDFYLPDYDIYLEHYGVNEEGEPPSRWSKVEREKYKDGMRWKRNLHAEAGNRYVESFSWWHHRGVLLENLEKVLKTHGVEFRPRTPKEIFEILCEKEKQKLGELGNLLTTFIQLFKSNDYSEDHFDLFIAQQENAGEGGRRNKTFLELARRVYQLYEKELADTGKRDFNDMLNKATAAVREMPSGALPYAYLIVDEYQDATIAQMKLLKAVLDNTGAHLFCVGDDWQSIFRFAGSDLSLFTEFDKYFGPASIPMRIENTYRNSQELIDIMSSFVLRNPEQLPKKMKSSRHSAAPVQMVWYTGNDDVSVALDQAIAKIAVELAGKQGEVLLLGRNQYDEKPVHDSKVLKRRGDGIYYVPSHPNISFQFMTVHKSKGLGKDYVIVLNAKDDLMGFPTRIADDPILQLVQHGNERFEFAEERRLFYVAITRTRNRVFILAPEKNYSPFVAELLEIMGGTPPPPIADGEVACPKCQSGVLISEKKPHGWFTWCSNFPECDWSANAHIGPETPRCPVCNGFLVERRRKQEPEHVFLGCTNYPYCKHTEALAGQTPQADESEITDLLW